MHKLSAVFIGFDHSGRAHVRNVSPPFAPLGAGGIWLRGLRRVGKSAMSHAGYGLCQNVKHAVYASLKPPLGRLQIRLHQPIGIANHSTDGTTIFTPWKRVVGVSKGEGKHLKCIPAFSQPAGYRLGITAPMSFE